jgi:GT2 family glycosyltransferase
MESSIFIAVLITSHNRKSMTLATLAALFNQYPNAKTALDVYLVDDGSTDGTTEAIYQQYDCVKIIQGTGSLFWNGGMRVAFAEAIQAADYDYHLWLNDDTLLLPNALTTLLETSKSLATAGFASAIVSGSTCDPETRSLTSGGFRRQWPKLLMRFDLIEPQEIAQQSDTFSGNCVLIPRSVYKVLGNLNPKFTHFLGDLDYGLRAQHQGYSVWITPGYVGTSPQHHGRGNEAYELNSFSEIFQKLNHPKGLCWGNDLQQRLMPMKEWTAFLKEHAGFFWLIPWVLTYRKLMGLVLGRWITKRI